MQIRFRHLGLGACAALYFLFAPLAAHATHIPPGTQLVNYDANLVPGVPVTGEIGFTNPVDGYDFFRILVDSGVPISFTSTRLSGTLAPNIVLYQGFATEGAPLSTLTFLAATNNSSANPATLNFTPNFTGAVTVVQSTFLSEAGGTYQLVGTGFRAVADTTPVPEPSSLALAGVGLVGLAGYNWRRRKSLRA